VPTAGPKSPSTSFKQRAICCSLWLPYTFALFFIWGVIFDHEAHSWADSRSYHNLQYWVQQNDVFFIAALVTIVAPLLAFSITRITFFFFTSGRRFRRTADHCPHCNYTLPVEGTHTCPECGHTSTHADRTAPTRAALALRDIAWLRRFTLACIIGFVGGPALVQLENALAQTFARRVFAEPRPLALPPPMLRSDYDPAWVDVESRYTDHIGGRMFWLFERPEPGARLYNRIFRLQPRITPWYFLGHKYVQEDGNIVFWID
jgi:hypothetical protein